MFELEEVTLERREAKDGEQLTDAQQDVGGERVTDGPCAPEAGNCGPTATCGPSQP